MNPIMARWGIRGMNDFTGEELAQLQQKLEGWIRRRAPQTDPVLGGLGLAIRQEGSEAWSPHV
jgi:hypothetical protein